MSRDVDRVVRRLAEIVDPVATLPPGPSPERYALLMEQDSLRREAAAFDREPFEGRATHELEFELAALKRLVDGAVASRTGFVTAKGGGSQSPSPGAWVGLSAKALRAAGLDRALARINRIEQEIARREASGQA
jgi:hypothetical protein